MAAAMAAATATATAVVFDEDGAMSGMKRQCNIAILTQNIVDNAIHDTMQHKRFKLAITLYM